MHTHTHDTHAHTRLMTHVHPHTLTFMTHVHTHMHTYTRTHTSAAAAPTHYSSGSISKGPRAGRMPPSQQTETSTTARQAAGLLGQAQPEVDVVAAGSAH